MVIVPFGTLYWVREYLEQKWLTDNMSRSEIKAAKRQIDIYSGISAVAGIWVVIIAILLIKAPLWFNEDYNY